MFPDDKRSLILSPTETEIRGCRSKVEKTMKRKKRKEKKAKLYCVG